MAKPLFRPESFEARQSAWLGRPTVLRSLPVAAFALFSVAFVGGLLALLVFGDYGRRVRVTGVVMPADGLARLQAPAAGRIIELRVREGDEVRRDDVLYVVGIDSSTQLGDTQGRVAALLRERRDELAATLARQADVDRRDKSRLADERAEAQREQAAISAEIAEVKAYATDLAAIAERQEQMLGRGLVRSSDVESRLQSLNAERARLAGLRRERLQIEARIAALEHDLGGFDLASEERLAAIRREMLGIEQEVSESEARRELFVRAPRDGLVTGILAQPGQTVAAADPLLTLVPTDQPLVAQLLAPSDAIGFLREGAPVLLRYEAFPYQKFGQHPGRVTVISRAALRPDDLAQVAPGPPGSDEPGAVYRITVQPETQAVHAYGRDEPLQAGMQVEAHVLVDTRPIYQWIFEPVYGLRGTLAAASGGGA
ncbi:HlyD family secretion protein [Paracoccus sp. (in: a-proteobacteria)]|uniref:HlyD family secretion protein n=1 Tax=Paracoccus sp. TaxID=267 RepID=UPI0026DFB4F1|nr:HlyD family efflux transporter periplasmic adaptor subunit [Paracoccus sp. (in: a-proteobacteria)]MDO5368907.1 HlyD family efflux transporter periplasmic adaptor subunit [Paracoccus sp. (in: a-proteobacteria)]